MASEADTWASPLPGTLGDRLRAVAPAVLLAVIAVLGTYNHVDHDQSSWEGASFGMFSTYENHVSRVVLVTVVGPDGRVQALLPPDLRDDALRLRVAPSQGAIDRLARDVLGRVEDEGATSVEVELRTLHLSAGPDGLSARYKTALEATAAP